MYVIAVNETTCNNDINPKGSFAPSDTLAYNCLFTVNIATGALTQVGQAFSPDNPVFGLTSCASKMWSQVSGLMAPLNGNQPATVGLPWASIDPTTGNLTEAGISTQIFGFDCLATGNTVYAMSTVFLGSGPTSIEPQGAAPGPSILALGTVDPATGVFTETVTISDSTAVVPYAAFAVAPVPVVPDPVAPVFTR